MPGQAAIEPRRPRAWLARWQAWRDRLVGTPEFRRRALNFALGRWMARRSARELFDLMAGFVYSQVLLACVSLHLFDRLRDGPLGLAALAEQSAVPAEAMSRLLDAAVALRLLERRGSALYGLGSLGAAMVDNLPLAAMVEHHAALYADLADPVALLRGRADDRALAGFWPYAGAASPRQLVAGQVADYSSLMSASQPLVAEEVLHAYPIEGHRCLMDVGGGEGVFLETAARRAAGLRLVLFDLPAVAQRAHARFQALGLSDRASAIGGDFLRDRLPVGADVISLVRVVHDQDDAGAQALLRASHAALPPGGVLLLAEPMAATPGAQAMGDAYFGLYLLAMGRGKPRTAAELTQRLLAAGFAQVQQRATRIPLQTSLLVASR